jgi:hypothetical protein
VTAYHGLPKLNTPAQWCVDCYLKNNTEQHRVPRVDFTFWYPMCIKKCNTHFECGWACDRTSQSVPGVTFCKLGRITCGLVYCEYPITFHTAGKMSCIQKHCILCHVPKKECVLIIQQECQYEVVASYCCLLQNDMTSLFLLADERLRKRDNTNLKSQQTK